MCTPPRVSKREVTIGLQTRVAQDRGQQLCTNRERVDEHVLVRRMRAGALGAEPVEHRHAERADEVAVRASRGRDLAEVEPERAAVLARALKEHAGAFAPLERRSRPATVELDARAGGLGLEAVEE